MLRKMFGDNTGSFFTERRHERLQEDHTTIQQSNEPPVAENCCQNPKNLAIVGGVAMKVKAHAGFALAIYLLYLKYYGAWVGVAISGFTLFVTTPALFWGIYFEKRRYLTLWLLWNLLLITVNVVSLIILVHSAAPISVAVIVGVFTNVTWIALASRPVYVFRKVLKALDPSVEGEPHF
ncbi:uncharacterized protein LOC122264367 [Penaeus japonicus]|uniref:uncharacterized protein LOC122264367 n=1 Tax=Penaeus japonicus TaxID=27405 RepID=UPI001C715683|nr:uncharacterized protein LOC122264367 [Penaeus japonicus]